MLISLIFLSVVSKGMIPIIICILGTTLIYSSIVLPYSGIVDNEPFKLDGASIVPSYQAVLVASQMHFFLGIGAVVLSIIVAYRPSALFTRNRPISLEEAWSKYHVWHDNAKLVDGYSEPSILVTQLMDDQDRYSMWRYEYVLVVIYGTPHLVRPSGYVPLNSEIIRDRESGRIVGKARYTGFA